MPAVKTTVCPRPLKPRVPPFPRLPSRPVYKPKIHARRSGDSLEIPPVSGHERKLARYRYCRDQDDADVLTLAARHTGPEVGCHSRCFLVKGQDDAVRNERLEGL